MSDSMSDGAKSSTDFFIRLNAGTESAADRVDRRYREQLCSLVERELGRRFARRQDPEDVVQLAFRSFFRGIKDGRFRIDGSGGLWKLLERITRSKILKQVEYDDAKKRTPEKEVHLEEAQWLPAREPTPDDATHVADLIGQVLEGLHAPDPEIFRLRLQGHTRGEISRRVGCTEAAVRIKLDRVRSRLRRLLGPDPHV